VPEKSKELAINKGIELMLRRAKKEPEKEPLRGFGIKTTFSFLKRRVHFNFDLRWEKQ